MLPLFRRPVKECYDALFSAQLSSLLFEFKDSPLKKSTAYSIGRYFIQSEMFS